MKKDVPYFDKVHRWGRIWTLLALVALFSVPLVFSLAHDAWPEPGPFLKGLVAILPLYWVSGIIETFTYTPMIGAGGTYLSFVTGNIANLKLPCAIAALEKADVKGTSDEGEVISTIAIASSAITTTVIIAAGVLLFSIPVQWLTKSPIFAPAFQQIFPAMFGALMASYLRKHWKTAAATVLIGCIVVFFSPSIGIGILIVVTIVAAVLTSFLFYKISTKKSAAK